MPKKKKTTKSRLYRGTGEPERRETRRAKVLVPIDFSECSRRALDFAVEYIQSVPSELYLFHVFEPMSRMSFVGKKLADRLDAELERMEGMAIGELERMVKNQEVKKKLKNFHCRVANGKPWEEILRMAGNINADIIMIGSHGREGIERALIGSQTEKVVRRAPCTVVCVKARDPYFVMP